MSNDGDENHTGSTAPTADPEQIAAALRSAVQKQFKLNGSVIPSAMRARVEEELGLTEGFFRSDPHWKAECKEIIKSEFVSSLAKSQAGRRSTKLTRPCFRIPQTALTDAAEEEEAPSNKKKPVKKPAAKKSAAKPRAKKTAPKPAKTEPASDEDVAIDEEDEDETPKKPAGRRGKATAKTATPRGKAKSTVQENEGASVKEVKEAVPAPVPAAAPDDDDSELSELEDEPPKKPVKRARATSNASPKKPTPKRSKAKPTVKEESDAEEAAPPPPAAVAAPAAVGSDSELSELDEPPKKSSGKRSLGASAKTNSPKKKAKVTPKASPKDETKTEAVEELGEQEERPSAPEADDAGSDSEMSVVLDPTPKKGRSNTMGKISAPKKTKSPKTPAGRKSKAKKADVSYA